LLKLREVKPEKLKSNQVGFTPNPVMLEWIGF